MVQFFGETLPMDLIRGNLLPLLSPRCIAMLDCAVCNQLSRSQLLDALVGYRVHLNIECGSTTALALLWLQERKMFVRNFSIVENTTPFHRLKEFKLDSVFSHLENLEVCGKDDTGEKMFLYLTSHVSRGALMELRIHGWDSSISQSAIATCLEQQWNIKKITLLESHEVTDRIFSIVARHCPRLEELTISSCSNVCMDNATVNQFFQTHPSLKTIGLGGQLSNRTRPENTLAAIGQFCRNLIALDLSLNGSDVTDESIAPILEGCPFLHTLNVGQTDITAAGFVTIARKCSHLAHLLLTLNVEDPQMVEGFKLLSGRLVTFTGVLKPHIVELSAPYWGTVLRVLELRWCPVTDALMLCIAQNCPNLTHLKLLWGEDMTDESLIALSSHTRNLQVVNIHGGHNFTDRGFVALARGCRDLRRVYISRCTSLTEEGLRALVRECPRLVNVLVESCTVDHHLLLESFEKWIHSRHFGIVGFR